MKSFKRKNRYNRKGLRVGYWEFYHDNEGNLHSKGLFKNGKEEGIWLWYNTKGVCINDNL